jgi:uncharacterized protein YjbJ (UPF0337 family)
MARDNSATQKLKGKAQKAIGEYQQRTGQGVKGGISKAKGELNERLADAKNKFGRDNKSKDEVDDRI